MSPEGDVDLAALFLQAIARHPARGIAHRGPGTEVELPHVLETGQRCPVVDTLFERYRLVGAERLAREHLVPGAGDDHAGAVDGELLQAAVGHLVEAAHALPGPGRGRGRSRDRRGGRLVDLDLVR